MDFERVFKKPNYESLSDVQKRIYHMFDDDSPQEENDELLAMLKPKKKDTALLKDLLVLGHKEGWVTDPQKYPMMPELLYSAMDTSMGVDWRITQNYKCSTKEETDLLSFMWCAFTGMACVYLCNEDWESLRKEGLIYKLERICGFNKIDEFAIKVTKIKDYDSLAKHLKRIAQAAEDVLKNHNGYEAIQRKHCTSAMYMYGMTIGMQRLGLLSNI